MASRLEIFEQVRTRSMQPIAIDVANSHHCQTTTCFVDEDDEVMFSQVRCLRRKAWFDMRSPQRISLAVVREPQIHLSRPSYVEEEDELVDIEFQEDEFVDEEFQHGDVHKDVDEPSQGFMDWDSLPTYDTEVVDEDLAEGSLSYNHEEESGVDQTSPPIYDIYLREDDLLEEVSFVVYTEHFIEENNNYHVLDESLKSEVFDLGV